MIIIGQKKETITNYDNIIHITIDDKEKASNRYKICAIYPNCSVILGVYSTDERAKKILHEIVFSTAKIYKMPEK